MTLRNSRPRRFGHRLQLRYAFSFGFWGGDRFRGRTICASNFIRIGQWESVQEQGEKLGRSYGIQERGEFRQKKCKRYKWHPKMNHSEFHPNRTTGKRLKKVSGGRGRISENVEVFAVQWHAVTSKCPKCWGFCLQWHAVTLECPKCWVFCLQWHAVTSEHPKCWGFCLQWHAVTSECPKCWGFCRAMACRDFKMCQMLRFLFVMTCRDFRMCQMLRFLFAMTSSDFKMS